MDMEQHELKKILKEHGLTQAKLAEKLGISRQHLHDILKLNRKSKYSEQIFELLKQAKEENNTILTDNDPTPKGSFKIESLPMVVLDDIFRIYNGDVSLNLLQKPFYAKYPFINFTEERNDFCLRLGEIYTNDSFYMAAGAFQLKTEIEFKKDQIVLLYLPDLQKIILGKAGINSETKEKYIVNDKAIFPLRNHDILIAECTQIVHFLP